MSNANFCEVTKLRIGHRKKMFLGVESHSGLIICLEFSEEVGSVHASSVTCDSAVLSWPP